MIKCNPLWIQHLKSHSCEIRCFCYFRSKIITTKNRSNIIINRENSLFVINITTFGKVNQKEESIDAVKREIKEELGYENIEFSFLAISEEFVIDKGFYNQQINLVYQGMLNEPIEKFKFKGLEGDWINFEWIDISNIDNYEIYPNGIKEAIKNTNKIYHYIENLTK